MNVIPFKLEHLQALRLQPSQQAAQMISPEHAQMLGFAYTGISHGEPIGCAGLFEIWPGRALAWAYLSEAAGREFVAVHRAVKRALDLAPWRRIEAYVERDFNAGHRWMLTLGFAREGLLRALMQDGRDMVLYARVRDV